MSRPRHFEPVGLRDVERLSGSRWRAVGTSPLIALRPRDQSALPRADVRVSIAFRTGEGAAAPYTSLVVDEEARALRIPLPVPRAGRITAVVTLPPDIRSLAVDPGPGTFELGEVTVTNLAPLSALFAHAVPQLRRLARHPGELLVMAGRAARLLRYRGMSGVLHRLRQGTHRQNEDAGYPEWVERYATLSEADRAELRVRVQQLSDRPLISILLMPDAEAGLPLQRTLEALGRQLYPRWELLVAARDISVATRELFERVDPTRLRVLSPEMNLADVRGTVLVRLRPGDALSEDALFAVVHAFQASRQVALVYSDEDREDATGKRSEPAFKPEWSPELLRSRNYIGRAAFFNVDRLRKLAGLEGRSQHDLLLRFTAGMSPDQVRHLPAPLFHEWPEAAGSPESAGRDVPVVQAYLDEARVPARVEPGLRAGTYWVRYALPDPAPRVTVIIPTRDHATLLRRCVESLQRTTEYPALELLVVDNDSRQPRARAYLEMLERTGVARVLRYPHPFNYSAINNLAVQAARGEVLCFLNNDVEAIEPNWLIEMVSLALQPDVGAVGAKLLYPNGTVQHAGVVAGLLGVASNHYVREPSTSDGYLLELQVRREVSALIAACLVIRSDRFLKVGGFDETQLRVSFSDVDLCFKLLRAGYRNLWTPHARLRHLESASRGSDERRADRERFLAEESVMRERWADLLKRDPYYNPNLSLDSNLPRPAWPPRVQWPRATEP